MKQFLSLICMFMLSVSVTAQEQSDGIFYYLNDGDMSAEVTENIDDPYEGSITIPASVTFDGKEYTVMSVGDFAFYDCGSLTSVILPETISSIGMYAFQNCFALNAINMPENLAYIGEEAFGECYQLDNIKLPGTIGNIGAGAFEGCTSLKNITIGEGITSIPSSMFARCEALEEITIPESVGYIGDWAFSDCISLKKVNFNEGLQNIGECAFVFCYSLESVTLPSSLTVIGNNAFVQCIRLSDVTIPENVSEIGSYIFDNCEMLGCIVCKAAEPIEVADNKLIDYREQTVLYVPEGSCEAYKNAEAWKGFAEYREIKDGEKIDYSLKRIESNGLSFIVGETDRHLAKIVSPGIEEKYTGDIVIPSSVTDADGTEYIVNHIGEGAFELAMDLSSVTIPSSVTSIGEWAFSGCQTLPAIEIPESVTSIGDCAFFGCANIYQVTLHNALKYIGDSAFGGCFSLRSVFSEIEEPFNIFENTFDFHEDQTLYVPEGCMDIYKSTDYWWRFQYIEEDEMLSVDDISAGIESNNKIYDLQGRRVNTPVKGNVYIKNNKKIAF